MLLNKARLLFILVSLSTAICLAEEGAIPYGEINADNINVRSDSTVTSQVIFNVNRTEQVEIMQESHDWYKIRLPKKAPAYIKKTFVNLIEPVTTITPAAPQQEKLPANRSAKVLKDSVNIRSGPGESSAIIGKVNKNEIINILEESGDWYKIEPVANSYGWIHKKFVNKAAAKTQGTKTQNTPAAESIAPEDETVIEGIIQPYGMVFRRIATHKLITKENNAYLLKGDKKTLNTLANRKVKVTGKITLPKKEKYPVIEILKLEVVD